MKGSSFSSATCESHAAGEDVVVRMMMMVVTMMSFIPTISYVMKGLWPHCSCCWGKWGLKKDHWRQFQITFTLHIRVGAPVIIMANLMMVATSVVIPSKLTANHNFFIMSDWWHIFGNSSWFLPGLKIWSWQSHCWAQCCRMQRKQKQVHRELDQQYPPGLAKDHTFSVFFDTLP